jgi:hypothetical protein
VLVLPEFDRGAAQHVADLHRDRAIHDDLVAVVVEEFGDRAVFVRFCRLAVSDRPVAVVSALAAHARSPFRGRDRRSGAFPAPEPRQR